MPPWIENFHIFLWNILWVLYPSKIWIYEGEPGNLSWDLHLDLQMILNLCGWPKLLSVRHCQKWKQIVFEPFLAKSFPLRWCDRLIQNVNTASATFIVVSQNASPKFTALSFLRKCFSQKWLSEISPNPFFSKIKLDPGFIRPPWRLSLGDKPNRARPGRLG